MYDILLGWETLLTCPYTFKGLDRPATRPETDNAGQSPGYTIP